MKFRGVLFVVLVFAAAGVFAQDRSVDVSAFASWVDPTGDGTVNRNAVDEVGVDFDHAMGYGAAVNVFWGNRVSTEFAIASYKPEATLRSSNPAIPAFTGDLNMIPITAILQYHFMPDGRIDPYIGAGAAYVMFDNLNSPSDVGGLGFSSIDFKDDVGLALNAGLSIDITPNFAIVGDAKYVPVKSSAKAVYTTGPGEGTDIDINPFMISAGVQFQF